VIAGPKRKLMRKLDFPFSNKFVPIPALQQRLVKVNEP
jgi:hypothetical protein